LSVAETVAFKYRAFLSYSHRDTRWAKWLHGALEGYRIDKELVGRSTAQGPIPKALRPIFRDREDFSAGHSLTQQTLAALEASQFLIVICSPNAAQSQYVNEEIRRFKAMGRADRVIPVIVDGEPANPERECFPAALRFKLGPDGAPTDEREEPLAAGLGALQELPRGDECRARPLGGGAGAREDVAGDDRPPQLAALGMEPRAEHCHERVRAGGEQELELIALGEARGREAPSRIRGLQLIAQRAEEGGGPGVRAGVDDVAEQHRGGDQGCHPCEPTRCPDSRLRLITRDVAVSAYERGCQTADTLILGPRRPTIPPWTSAT